MSDFVWGKECGECKGSGDYTGEHAVLLTKEHGYPCKQCNGHGRLKHTEGCWVCGKEAPWPTFDREPVVIPNAHLNCLSDFILHDREIK